MKISFEYDNNQVEVDINQLSQIGKGIEGTVYKCKNLDVAIKLYNNNIYKILTHDNVNKFKNIKTKRILMPLNPVYNKLASNIFIYNGYITKLIENIKDKKDLVYISSDTLNNELHLLNDDVNIITKNRIIICDLWNSDNFIYNGNLYYIDPGSYILNEYASLSDIYKENVAEIGMSLHKNLFCHGDNLENIKEELKKIGNIDIENCNIDILNLIKKIYTEYHFHYELDQKNYMHHLINMLDKYESLVNYKYAIIKEYINDYNNDDIDIKSLKKIIK